MSWISLHSNQTNQVSQSKTRQSGFGLVELLVSISIITIVSGIVLSRHSAFNGAVLLRSQAYEIALTARELQLNAVSASGVSGQFRTVLGIHFDTATTTDGLYRVFRDADNDGFYDTGEASGQQGKLDPRFEIKAIRAVGDTITGSAVSIVFERPNFDARFFDSSGEISASRIEIDVARRDTTGSTPDVVRTLEITATGQIAVQ